MTLVLLLKKIDEYTYYKTPFVYVLSVSSFTIDLFYYLLFILPLYLPKSNH